MFDPYAIMLSIRCVDKQVCLVNIYFLIVDVNIDEPAIKKINEITPVSCRQKFDFNNLWDPVQVKYNWSSLNNKSGLSELNNMWNNFIIQLLIYFHI